MKIRKQGAVLFAAVVAMACAAPTDDTSGDGDGDGDGDGTAVPTGTGAAPAGTGAAPAGTGAAPAGTGAAPAGTGAAPAGTGAAPAGTGAAPAGTGAAPAGTGGGTSGGTPCAAGTIAGTNPPTILAWETSDGTAATEVQGDSASTSIAAAEAYVNLTMSTWAMSGRECVDVSAFSGIQFDLATDCADMLLMGVVSQSDPAGHCAPLTDCYAHPRAATAAGTGVQVPFSSLAAATWGNMAPFNAAQSIGFTWMCATGTSGSIAVSNVSFY